MEAEDMTNTEFVELGNPCTGQAGFSDFHLKLVINFTVPHLFATKFCLISKTETITLVLN
jgi:hypothetical protein